uniref:Multidrug export protein EmrB n=1 Tax=Mycobacterium riyadhense TaxID=486698 RepID=A0A653F4I9_9MYCO|nr:Multidrug export protein EmrB [Mycobacterium riyadhense]
MRRNYGRYSQAMRQADRPRREPKTIASTHATDGSRLDDDARPVDYPTTLDSRLLMTIVACLMLTVMVTLDTTVVNVAQRTFIDEFSSTQALVAWTSTGYTLSLAAVIPLTGWAANRLGTKRLAIASVLLFTFGSLLCGMASNITQLVAFRALQGLGGGIVIPLQLIILARAAGPARLARVMTISNITALMAPIFGPVLGGWLISSFGWQWIFLINIPMGALALALAVFVLPSNDSLPAESLDVLGMIVLSPGLVLLLYGLSLLPERGTASDPHTWVPITVGVMLTGAFVLHALRRADHALIDLRLLKNRTVAAANGTRFVFAVAFFGSCLLFPAYFQQVLGKTPLQSGLVLIPQSLAAAVTVPIVGRLMETRGPRRVVLGGTAATVVGMGMFVYGMSQEHVHLTVLLAGLATFGAGSACMMVPVSWSAVHTLNSSEVAHGSTLFNVNHTVAASVGAALMSVMLTSRFNASANIAAARQADSIRAEAARRLAPLDPAKLPSQVRLPNFTEHLTNDLSLAYAGVFLIATIVVAATVVPASLLPKRPGGQVELLQVEP